MMKLKRFSLVELLVVISIISILASLLPVLQKAMAHSIVCLNNLKTTGSAVVLYMNDNGDWLVPGQLSSCTISQGTGGNYRAHMRVGNLAGLEDTKLGIKKKQLRGNLEKRVG